MNQFYAINIVLQWIIALAMTVLNMIILTSWLNIPNFVLLATTAFIAIPIAQFLMTPLFKLTGMYKYLSPMLLVFSPNKKKYDLHNGTSFDYLMVMRKVKKGKPFKNKVLEYYLEGLLKIVEKIENKELPETLIVRGSSYFFSERTAQRLGFTTSKTNFFEQFNLLLNYTDLCWTLSVANGKLTFPDLRNIKTASTTGEALVANKAYLLKLYNRLKK